MGKEFLKEFIICVFLKKEGKLEHTTKRVILKGKVAAKIIQTLLSRYY